MSLLGGNVLSVAAIVRLVVVFGLLVGFCFVFTCLLFLSDAFFNKSASSLQKSVLHRQANIEPEPSSVISL